jgi:hypothetical protein
MKHDESFEPKAEFVYTLLTLVVVAKACILFHEHVLHNDLFCAIFLFV